MSEQAKPHTGGMLPRKDNPAMRRIVAEFEKGEPMTKHDLAERCFMVHRNAGEYINILKGAEQIHIHDYVRIGRCGAWSPRWIFGPGEDAKKPKPVSNKVRQKRWRSKEGVSERYAARKRAERFAAKLGLKVAGITINLTR